MHRTIHLLRNLCLRLLQLGYIAKIRLRLAAPFGKNPFWAVLSSPDFGRSVTYLTLSQPEGEGADYARHITTCLPLYLHFSDLSPSLPMISENWLEYNLYLCLQVFISILDVELEIDIKWNYFPNHFTLNMDLHLNKRHLSMERFPFIPS